MLIYLKIRFGLSKSIDTYLWLEICVVMGKMFKNGFFIQNNCLYFCVRVVNSQGLFLSLKRIKLICI